MPCACIGGGVFGRSVARRKGLAVCVCAGSGGAGLFCSEEYAAVYPDAERAEGICSAEDGGIAVAVADKEYSGTYRKADGDGKSALYVALFGEEEWNMVCGVTERTDGEEYTLILSSKGYAVTFYADVD